MRWLALLFLPLPAFAEITVTQQAPRAHGWWLGDVLEQRIAVALPEGVAVDPASLPRPRSAEYWLDLRSVAFDSRDGAAQITLVWQNFYSALEPSRREVAGPAIRLSDGRSLSLPGFSFVTSPIRPILAPSTPDQLQPDPDYRLIDTRPTLRRLALSLAALALAAAGLARSQAWWPFHRRAARPLTRAARTIAALRQAPPEARRQALHRGLDAAFGRVLIGAELEAFLTARPEFRPLQNRLATFFAASDAQFFGARSGSEPAGELRALARDLAAIERGRR